MTEFDKWYNNIEKEYPLHQDKDGYNIGNTRALKVGFKAALKWVLKELEVEESFEVFCARIRKEIQCQ